MVKWIYGAGTNTAPKEVTRPAVSRFCTRTLSMRKLPFYCAAWCNVKSVRKAIKSGFRPAWVEMTVKPCETVDGMNKQEFDGRISMLVYSIVMLAVAVLAIGLIVGIGCIAAVQIK